MWLFRKKKGNKKRPQNERRCPFCGNLETSVDTSGAPEGISPVKTWRGERLLLMKCLSCGREFYVESGADDYVIEDGRLIDDEEALRAAEEELKRQTDEMDDRRYRPG